MHAVVCVMRGWFCNMTQKTSQWWPCDGHSSPWPLVYLSNKKVPQLLKVRGFHIYKVTLKQRTGRLFELSKISRDTEWNQAEKKSFCCRYWQNWKCTITKSCGERLNPHAIILGSRGSFSCVCVSAFTHVYAFFLIRSWTSSRQTAWRHYLHPESEHRAPVADGIKEQRESWD